MADSSADRDPLERIAEEFVTRFRGGERPSLTEYAERHPELAEQIRDLFPALVEMEQLKPASGEHTVSAPAEPPRLECLAGFRILREIGRGGMGVVYEAVQEALGRHVALKVLPGQAMHDTRRRERFRREARAAARLHHTNIVPVFQTGEAGGVHFYAMQFIAGSGLDQVVLELRRLREGGSAAPAPGGPAAAPPAPTPAAQVARSLATASFEQHLAPETLTFGPEPQARPAATTVAAPAAPASPSPALAHAAGGPPESTLSAGTGRRYWESVARLGAQAAGALAHAHAQGVLHRDVKPSNLLLDAHGTLWVTDFGLAKIAEDDDLTAAGDILGTLRYMAPERFEGRSDARADVYALGLTLYELLTLRPAFDATGREKIIALVTSSQPARPSALSPQVPRDLETIVLKAIAREPEARYQTAAEMAEDLECFLQDRPIRARRASTIHRCVRWSRRNPVVAGLTTALALVLVAVAVGSTVAALSFRDLAVSETKARGDAEQKQRDVEDEKQKLVKDRDNQNRANTLFESGLRHSVRKEWPEALADFTRAAELKPDNSQVWSDRGGLYLRLGLAPEAAADFARLFELREPDEPAWWVFHAALRLHVGDRDGYRAACRGVRTHFPDASSPDAVRAVVRTCTLAPDGCDDPAQLVRLVEEAAERFPTEPFGELLVAALFRAGRHQDVVAATNPATAVAAADRSQRPAMLCFRAMSLARLNNAATARAALVTARDKLDLFAVVLGGQPFGPKAGQWFVGTFPPAGKQEEMIDWVVDDLLWREAGTGGTPAVGPHPLPLLIRARGCAAIGRWDQTDVATAEAVRLCPDDPTQQRLADLALVERARLNAVRGRWAETAADFATAQKSARSATRADMVRAQTVALYTAFGKHEDARRHLSERIAKVEADPNRSFGFVSILKQERAQRNIQLEDWDAAASDLNAVLNDPSLQPRRPKGWGGGFGGGFLPGDAGGGFAPFPGGPPPAADEKGGTDPRVEVRRAIVRHDEVYKRVSALRSGDFDLRQERGKFLAAAKRWDEAREFYLGWLKNPHLMTFEPFQLPGETQADARRRNLFPVLSDDIAQWDQVFDAVVAKYPGVVYLWSARYHRLVRAKDYDRAADAILRTLPPAPGSPKGSYAPPPAYTTAASDDEVFRRVAEKRPTDGDLWMARFRVTQHQPGEKGMRAAVEVIKRCGDQPQWVSEAAFWLARSADAEKALAVYADVLKARPNDPEVQMGHCLLLIRLKKWDEAVAAFDSALKVVPPAVPGVPVRVTASSLYHMIPFDETTLAEFTKRRKDDARLLTVHGRQLANSGKDAIPVFVKATVMAPKDLEAWLELGRAYVNRQRWKEAAAAYDKHLSLLPALPPLTGAPNGPPLPAAYGEIVSRGVSGPNGPARPLLDAVLELRPDDVRLRLELCRFLRNVAGGTLPPANPALRADLNAALDALVKAAPKEPLAWMERARYRMAARELDKAVEDFVAAGKLFPRKFNDNEHGPVMFPMYGEIADNPQFFAAYTKASPGDPFPWHFRGMRRSNPAHPEHATWHADFTRAIEILPTEPAFRNLRRWNAYLLGEWERAAVEYSAEITRISASADDVMWLECGCAFAAAGDSRRYRAFCRRMADTLGEPSTPVQKQRFVMTQLLLPEPKVDPRKMLELAQDAFDANPKPWWNTFAVALAHVRAGAPGKAVPLLRDYLKAPDTTFWGVQDRVVMEFLLAVALARDGEKGVARDAFEGASRTMDGALYVGTTRRMSQGGIAHIWATCDVLRREADGLMNNVPPPPRPVGEKPK